MFRCLLSVVWLLGMVVMILWLVLLIFMWLQQFGIVIWFLLFFIDVSRLVNCWVGLWVQFLQCLLCNGILLLQMVRWVLVVLWLLKMRVGRLFVCMGLLWMMMVLQCSRLWFVCIILLIDGEFFFFLLLRMSLMLMVGWVLFVFSVLMVVSIIMIGLLLLVDEWLNICYFGLSGLLKSCVELIFFQLFCVVLCLSMGVYGFFCVYCVGIIGWLLRCMQNSMVLWVVFGFGILVQSIGLLLFVNCFVVKLCLWNVCFSQLIFLWIFFGVRVLLGRESS